MAPQPRQVLAVLASHRTLTHFRAFVKSNFNATVIPQAWTENKGVTAQLPTGGHPVRAPREGTQAGAHNKDTAPGLVPTVHFASGTRFPVDRIQ